MDLKKYWPPILFFSVGAAGASIQWFLPSAPPPQPPVQEVRPASPLLDADHAWLNPPTQSPPPVRVILDLTPEEFERIRNTNREMLKREFLGRLEPIECWCGLMMNRHEAAVTFVCPRHGPVTVDRRPLPEPNVTTPAPPPYPPRGPYR